MKSVLKDLKSNLIANETVVIAVSGGSDSMLLLKLLEIVRQDMPINIVCAHVNHNVRSESKNEEEYLKKYCATNNIVFEGYKIENYPDKNNFQNYAREERYTFFEQVMEKHGTKKLLTAHHADDLLETILMRLARGSSLNGYMGFKKITVKNGFIIYRPLINVNKQEIIDYCSINKITYFNDKSNFENKYSRNRLRNTIIPLLKKENKQIVKHFNSFNEEISDLSQYINNMVEKEYAAAVIDNKILINEFLLCDEYIQKQLILKYLLSTYAANTSLINIKHVQSIMKLIKSSKTTGQINLPLEKVAVKKYTYVQIESSIKKAKYEYVLESQTALINGKTITIVESEEEDGNNICRINKKDVKLPLRVRNAKPGDRLFVKGIAGSKKISDILINDKIPAPDRSNIPVVVDDNDQIIWIPGIKKSNINKSKNDTCDIILKYQ